MQEVQSSSYNVMSKRSGKYSRGDKPLRKLNVSAQPIRVKSKNDMKKKASKAFAGKATARRMGNGQGAKNKGNTRAVSKVTSGRPGAGKTFAYNSKGIDTRVMQISPAQRSGQSLHMSKTVAETPIKQNKKPVSNGKTLGAFKKSIRKTMGY